VALPPRSAGEEWLTISGWDSREDAESYHRHPDRNQAVADWSAYYIQPPVIANYDEVIE